MNKLIFIKDSNQHGQLDVTLNMILDDINFISNTDFVWSILLLEASGDISGISSYDEIDLISGTSSP